MRTLSLEDNTPLGGAIIASPAGLFTWLAVNPTSADMLASHLTKEGLLAATMATDRTASLGWEVWDNISFNNTGEIWMIWK